jgi:alginate O-acetyltransferase complex protein AlgI
MFFDTTTYFVFLVLVVLANRLLRQHSHQNTLLLAASYFFYGWWDLRFLALMIASTIVDYWLARGIEKTSNPIARKRFLVLSLVMNFGLLGVFKYFNFFVDSFQFVAVAIGLGAVPHRVWEIALPPGISFYTFQAVAYIVDVYRREIPAVKSLRDYSLFISLFPHLIAGPIQRPSHLIPQVQSARTVDAGPFFDGLMLIIEGLFRKIVVADNCALVATAAFGGRLGHNAAATALGVLAFAFQIYGDFSGYSNIARGSAQLLGFHFMVNFRQPYLALSLSDFWRRWHISLSTWLRDYLYIGALGGNQLGKVRTYINLFLTMLLGGLWHGASWTFVFWGAWHGCGLAVERALGLAAGSSSERALLATVLRRLAVFLFVIVGWAFFRSTTISEAVDFLAGVAVWTATPVAWFTLVFLLAHVLPLVGIDLALETSGTEYLAGKSGYPARIVVALGLAFASLIFAANDRSAFIYFRF